MAMSLLSPFVAFQVSGKYLSIPENPPASLPAGFVKFVEPNIWNPRAKFAVEPAQTGDGKLVHIRSCYNNKYLVIGEIQNNNWLVAASNKPEEDQSKASCTLFEPWTISGETSVRLRHVQTQKSAAYISSAGGGWIPSSDTQHGLVLSEMADTSAEMLTVTDWQALVILPSQVMFSSAELEGTNYLCSRSLDPRWPYQRFESGADVADPVVAKDLFPTPDGNYRIKDVYFGKFWRRSPNWIWADAQDNDNSKDTLFSVVKISSTTIALRNLGNNYFCGPLTTEGKTNCLNARYPTLSKPAWLLVEECVLKREISDIRYRLSDSRIYQEAIQEVSHSFAANDSAVHDASITLAYSTSDSRTTHWDNTVSITFGLSVTFETAFVPFIAKGEVQLSTEFGYEHVWGESQTTEVTRESTYVVVVPPLTTMKVSLLSTTAACDVPFSYTQRDLLPTGEWVTTVKDDGIYTGINSFNFYFQSSVVTKDAQGKMFVA